MLFTGYAPGEGRLAVCGEPERSDVTTPMDRHNDERSGRDHYDGSASAALVDGGEAADRCCVVGTGCGGIRGRARSWYPCEPVVSVAARTLPAGRGRGGNLCGRDGIAGASFGAGAARSIRRDRGRVCEWGTAKDHRLGR